MNDQTPKNLGMYPTPPKPEDLPSIELTQNSRQILAKRYLRHGKDGKPVETIDEMFWRIAWHVSDIPESGENHHELAREFYNMLVSKAFFPNSPTFTGAGTPSRSTCRLLCLTHF